VSDADLDWDRGSFHVVARFLEQSTPRRQGHQVKVRIFFIDQKNHWVLDDVSKTYGNECSRKF
jgi:hypothetical protein